MDGIYAINFSGVAGRGHAVLVLQNGSIAGADILGPSEQGIGVQYDGTYEPGGDLVPFNVTLTIPPGVPTVQGHIFPTTHTDKFSGELPGVFDDGHYVPINTGLGQVQVHFKKLRPL